MDVTKSRRTLFDWNISFVSLKHYILIQLTVTFLLWECIIRVLLRSLKMYQEWHLNVRIFWLWLKFMYRFVLWIKHLANQLFPFFFFKQIDYFIAMKKNTRIVLLLNVDTKFKCFGTIISQVGQLHMTFYRLALSLIYNITGLAFCTTQCFHSWVH